MENHTALYYDGASARPTEARVLVFNSAVHLYDAKDDRLLGRFELKGTSYNATGQNHFLYLDQKGLQYVMLSPEHPLIASLVNDVSQANMSWTQKLMKQKIVFLLCFLIALMAGFYFLIISLVPFIGTRVIGIEQEIQMGEKMKKVMMQEASLTGEQIDEEGTKQLQAFADALDLSNQYPIRLTLVNSNIVNAYALPGGNVVVYSAILKKIKTPEALAALLAHESTHVNERHSLRSLLRSAANGLLISVLFSDATGISAALIGNAQALNGLRYSRSLEKEADEKGMDLLVHNNVSVDGMHQLMQTLQAEGDIPGSLSFLSSHPLTKERMAAAEKYKKEHPQTITKRKDLEALFEKLK